VPTPTPDPRWSHKIQPGSQSGKVDLPLPFEPGVIAVVHVAECDWASLAAHYGLARWRHTFAPPHTEFQVSAGLDRSYRVEVPVGTERATVTRLAAYREHFEYVGLEWVDSPRLAAIIGDVDAMTRCGEKAAAYGSLVGAFRSTAGEIADWVENVHHPDAPRPTGTAWRRMSPTAAAYLCYFDGMYGKGPAPVPGGTSPPPYDRALILIDANSTVVPPAKYGWRRNIPIAPPAGRF
jgi:hypothetical protein